MIVFQRLVIWLDGCVEAQGLNNALARINKLCSVLANEKPQHPLGKARSALTPLFSRLLECRLCAIASRSEIDCALVSKRDGL
jgi:hypothetical protein